MLPLITGQQQQQRHRENGIKSWKAMKSPCSSVALLLAAVGYLNADRQPHQQ
jgi:hypothetical protein